MPRALIVGNSDGIGLALTRRLLATGWTVTGLSRRPAGIDDEHYAHHLADVSDGGYPAVLGAALGGDGVDLCVYAAGIGEFLDVDDLAAQTRTLDVNLLGLARTAEQVLPPMVRARSGHLIGLSSLADAAPSPIAPAYAASKAGMTTYLQGLTLAMRPHGVAVTTIRFGFVDTKMAKSPVKPALITAEKAAEVVLRATRSRPATLSYPRRMAVAARALAVLPSVQLRRGGPR
jgi:NAD(P)-dependent dehydrogenase (short-subunit alcohol dehydrogenase family)